MQQIRIEYFDGEDLIERFIAHLIDCAHSAASNSLYKFIALTQVPFNERIKVRPIVLFGDYQLFLL